MANTCQHPLRPLWKVMMLMVVVVAAMKIWVLCVRCFTHINSFILIATLWTKYYYYPHFRWENWGMEVLIKFTHDVTANKQSSWDLNPEDLILIQNSYPVCYTTFDESYWLSFQGKNSKFISSSKTFCIQLLSTHKPSLWRLSLWWTLQGSWSQLRSPPSKLSSPSIHGHAFYSTSWPFRVTREQGWADNSGSLTAVSCVISSLLKVSHFIWRLQAPLF